MSFDYLRDQVIIGSSCRCSLMHHEDQMLQVHAAILSNLPGYVSRQTAAFTEALARQTFGTRVFCFTSKVVVTSGI